MLAWKDCSTSVKSKNKQTYENCCLLIFTVMRNAAHYTYKVNLTLQEDEIQNSSLGLDLSL